MGIEQQDVVAAPPSFGDDVAETVDVQLVDERLDGVDEDLAHVVLMT
jgi:hypothetical protein